MATGPPVPVKEQEKREVCPKNGWGSLCQKLDQRCRSQEGRAEQMGKMRQVAEEKQSNSQSGGRGSKGGEAVIAKAREQKDP